MESLQRLGSIDMGLEPEGLITGSLYLMPDRYASSVEMWTTYNQILERVRALPGVSEAGLSAELPIEGGFGCTVQGFEDPTVYDHLSDIGLSTCAGQEPTSPGYFEAARIPLLQGRVFTDRDNNDPASGSVVVSRAFADRFWPGEDPIGKGVAPSGRNVPPFYHVVGVVGDVPARSLDGDPAIAIYYPMVHHPDTPTNWRGFQPSWMRIVVRTELADPLSIAPELRAAVRAVDPLIPLDDIRSMESIVSESVARYTFTSVLLSIAAVVALTLAAVE